MTLTFDYVEPDQLQDAINIEQDGYPADEAASLSAFRLRQSQAPDLFLGAYIDGKLVGYVCSTLSNDETLTEESMKRHVPGGKSVCVHSVCVDRGMWGKGVGGRLLGEYVKRVGEAGVNKYERILLITHDELRGFYEKAGFEWVGESSVVHGARKWYEMRILLDRAPQISQDVLKELLKPTQKEELRTPHLVSSSSSQVPSSAQQSTSQERTSQEKAPNFLSEFKDAFEDLVVQHPTDQGVLVNKYDLMCPRGCRSVILKRGVGIWNHQIHLPTPSSLLSPPRRPPRTGGS
ncbi:serotonin N-acetyltransferase [Coprinopsis cinerea okayama7|uniref:Serotonin N-acetyltransferase n=1 Tax=Coprinopsis cinerea (strain Okayama-7 / 130 / ATCC MYA-4618 / FGSC 9003) TaxID=240176 RepID=A8NMM8_COPC7|nr:serotonin N-acetyltransferase [Coprinopsis cinerea okayama7\|eukprot:XP_001834952.2 serotonin N-acetyltransferase [Coprinopsis cinerea okayama7\